MYIKFEPEMDKPLPVGVYQTEISRVLYTVDDRGVGSLQFTVRLPTASDLVKEDSDGRTNQ